MGIKRGHVLLMSMYLELKVLVKINRLLILRVANTVGPGLTLSVFSSNIYYEFKLTKNNCEPLTSKAHLLEVFKLLSMKSFISVVS